MFAVRQKVFVFTQRLNTCHYALSKDHAHILCCGWLPFQDWPPVHRRWEPDTIMRSSHMTLRRWWNCNCNVITTRQHICALPCHTYMCSILYVYARGRRLQYDLLWLRVWLQRRWYSLIPLLECKGSLSVYHSKPLRYYSGHTKSSLWRITNEESDILHDTSCSHMYFIVCTCITFLCLRI